MQTFAHIVDGVVREVVELADGKVLGEDLYPAAFAAECVLCDASVIQGMLYDADKASFSDPPPPARGLSVMARELVASATDACAFVTQQVIPDETHRTAYTNAATIVWGSGGQAPTSEPAATAFAAQAAALGLSVATFAAVVQAVSLLSLQLGATLSALRGEALAAKATSDLAAALSAFETAQASIVAALNGAGLTVTIEVPAPILIAGVNA